MLTHITIILLTRAVAFILIACLRSVNPWQISHRAITSILNGCNYLPVQISANIPDGKYLQILCSTQGLAIQTSANIFPLEVKRPSGPQLLAGGHLDFVLHAPSGCLGRDHPFQDFCEEQSSSGRTTFHIAVVCTQI